MRRLPLLGAVLALIGAVSLVMPAEAQGRFWVLVNGSLRYTGNVAVTGTLTATSGVLTPGPLTFGTNPAGSGNVMRAPNNSNLINVRNAANNGDLQTMFYDTNNLLNLDPQANGILYGAKTFAALGTPANGSFYYCSDCTIASPCAGSGTGAFAKRLNATWVCN